MGYILLRFRQASVIVFPKPGKSSTELQEVGGYRRITLLSSIGKIIDSIIAKRITEAVESQNLLPEGQMGNRKGRSTESVISLVVEGIRTV